MSTFEIFSHYNNSVRIKFYPKTHRYQKEGQKDFLVSSTGATGMLDKSAALLVWASRLTESFLVNTLQRGEPITEALIKQAAWLHKEEKEKAATTGSAVHEWIEQYVKGEKPKVPEDEKIRNGVLGFLKWIKEDDIKFIANEQRVYSKQYDYVGKMDVKFTKGKGENHRIVHGGDYKTSSGFYLSQAMQLAGYEYADTEEHGVKYGTGFIIRLDKDTGAFQLKEFSREEMEMFFEGFLDCLGLKNLSKYWDKNHNKFYQS